MSGPAELMDDWLVVGAAEKASSVEYLTKDLGIVTVLEVGCGTGAILAELVKRGVGHEYAGCEPSPGLFEKARARQYGVDVDLRCMTFEESGFSERQWDLIVLSHVLEHTPDPAGIVGRILGSGRYLVLEVPLEGTWTGGIRARLKWALTKRPRTDNAAGHIQFFSAADIHRLVRWSGGRVLRTRTYFPAAAYRRMRSEANGLRRLYYAIALVASRVIGSGLTSHLYYGHFAALVAPRLHDDQSVVPHPLFWHPDKAAGPPRQ